MFQDCRYTEIAPSCYNWEGGRGRGGRPQSPPGWPLSEDLQGYTRHRPSAPGEIFDKKKKVRQQGKNPELGVRKEQVRAGGAAAQAGRRSDLRPTGHREACASPSRVGGRAVSSHLGWACRPSHPLWFSAGPHLGNPAFSKPQAPPRLSDYTARFPLPLVSALSLPHRK